MQNRKFAKLQQPPNPTRFAQWRQKRRQSFTAWLILTPVLIYYFFFYLLPVVANLAVSFLNWDGFGQARWVGFANFTRFFTSPRYLQVLGNTALFAIVILLATTALGLLVALALNRQIKGIGLYRTLWYIPTLTSAAVMAQMATLFIAPGSGVLSAIRSSLGQPDIIWQIDVGFSRLFIILFSVWRGVGMPMLLYLAALQGIPQSLIDAAKVDGATSWHAFRYVTLPLLRPMTAFVLVTGLIGSFQIFEPILLITTGKPRNTTNVLMLQIYNDAFQNQNFGMAAAMATIMLLILVWASYLNLRMLGQTSVEE